MIHFLDNNFFIGIVTGLVLGVSLGLLYAQKKLNSENSEKIDHFFNHYLIQSMTVIALFMIIIFLPIIDIVIKLIIICLVAGLYLLFGLRYIPKKCVGSNCNDVRCDITILKLYGKLCFTFILFGGFLIIFYLLENIIANFLY